MKKPTPNPKKGFPQYYRGKMYFHDVDWATIIEWAKKKHKSPQHIVIDALKRGIRRAKKKEGVVPTSLSRSRRP